MKLKKSLLSTALLSALSAPHGFAMDEHSSTPKGKEKCTGIAKKGQNDCGTSKHGCAGLAEKDYDSEEWIYVKSGTCKKLQEKVAKMQLDRQKKMPEKTKK